MKINVSALLRTALLLIFLPVLIVLSGCDKDDDLSVFTDARDGQEYAIITIGTQTWMAENLNYTPTAGDYWCFDNDPANCAKYGRLYDWSTALTVAPAGWHLPSDAEWTTLTNFLGGEAIAGGHLKEAGTDNWEAPNTGADNSSGFTALPGGARLIDMFLLMNTGTGFWTSTEKEIDRAWSRILDKEEASVFRTGSSKENGYSIRCIMD